MKSVFEKYIEQRPEVKGIYARVPATIHGRIAEISAETKWSLYKIITIALSLFIEQYDKDREAGRK
jgi:hypothetical protein